MPELLLTMVGIALVVVLTAAAGSAISWVLSRCWPCDAELGEPMPVGPAATGHAPARCRRP